MIKAPNPIARLNRRKKESEKGFSLIELIVVIVILGILIAIAIPVYNNIQEKARHSAVDTAASNAASEAAAAIAAGETVDVSSLQGGDVKTVSVTGATVDAVCATATGNDGYTKSTGPGCATPAP